MKETSVSNNVPQSGADNQLSIAGRFTDLDQDKLRGGYYTSSEVSSWLCAWGIRSSSEQVLEPSCGDGSFLEAAALRLLELGAKKPTIAKNLTGVEIIPGEANHSTSRLQPLLGLRARNVVETADFFSWWQEHEKDKFDVIIGNPPFIRYQTFPEPHRSRAMDIMQCQGLKPNRLTNIWVPFVVAAMASLKSGGRLAMVLPAELLQVTYAAQLRSFITDRFSRVDIVACNELFFKKAQQEVVLLLADGALPVASKTNSCRVTLTETLTVSEIIDRKPDIVLKGAEPKTVRHDNEKWLKYFLTDREIKFMRELRSSDITTCLETHANVDVGVVTGKNEFFVLSGEQTNELGLQEYTTPLVSRSAQLQGAQIGKAEWRKLSSGKNKMHLLNLIPFSDTQPTGALARYIKSGEEKGVHTGYKCSIRKQWFVVPSVWVPDGFMFRQIHNFPRLVLNKSGATSTDTIHRLRCKAANTERVIANTYTWLTSASAEIEGRSYGGGVLELEPTEAERLLMPSQINGAMPLKECDKLTRAGRLDDVLRENARIVLKGDMGLSHSDCEMLRGIWEKMRDRRISRRKRGMAAAL